MGFPPQAWFAHRQIAMGYTGVFAALVDNMVRWDPGYFEEFWTEPGYLGFDAPDSLAGMRFQHETKISRVVMTKEAIDLGLPISMSAKFADSEPRSPAAIEVEQMPNGALQGATLNVKTGAAAGHRCWSRAWSRTCCCWASARRISRPCRRSRRATRC